MKAAASFGFSEDFAAARDALEQEQQGAWLVLGMDGAASTLQVLASGPLGTGPLLRGPMDSGDGAGDSLARELFCPDDFRYALLRDVQHQKRTGGSALLLLYHRGGNVPVGRRSALLAVHAEVCRMLEPVWGMIEVHGDIDEVRRAVAKAIASGRRN